MKVATLEKFHLGGGGNQDPGDPGGGKGVGGKDFFSFKQAGTDPGWHYERLNDSWPISWYWSLSMPHVIIRKPLVFWHISGSTERDQWHGIGYRYFQKNLDIYVCSVTDHAFL